MELLTEKQVAELIVEYENKVKGLIEKIKGELQNRKELKKKIEEAKQREALQLQILDRLEESEKLVRKQIDLVAKMEDNESSKQRELIKKYKQMLDEQRSTWEKYKGVYESLPSVKKIREAEAKYMCASIKHRLVLKKIKDAQRMVQLRELVRKKQEQALIVKFAQLMLDYMKRQKHCQELWNLNRKLTAQAQQLRQQLQEKENNKKQKLDVELQKASVLMKPQQLPQVDLTRFIIHRNKGQDKLDTMSINSYMLEEEYINNNGQSSEKFESSQSKVMDVDTQDSMQMEIDTQETNNQERELVHPNEQSRRLDFKGALDNKGETQSTPLVDECKVAEHNGTIDQEMDSQESNPDTNGTINSSRKMMRQMQQQTKENTPLNASFANDGTVQNEYSTPYHHSIPTSTKTTKSSFQGKHPRHQVAKQEMPKSSFQEKHSHHQTSKQDVTKSSFQEKHPHNQSVKHQEMMQQQQNSQASNHSVQENQQHNQSLRHSSQEMYQQQQVSRHSSQEMYQQQQKPSRQSSQEMYQQQQQQVYQQNQQQQQVYQQNQQQQQVYQQNQQQQQQVYQQNQQQQSSHYTPQQIYHQNQHQQETYLRSEPRPVFQQQIQVTPQNSKQMDFSKLPSANKPKIISNEYVNYNLQALNYKRSSKYQTPVEPSPRVLTETRTATSTSAMPKTDSTPYAYQAPFVNEAQPSVNATPISAVIEASSMMSTTMHSADNSYLIPDNISAILGSEITEPGGSLELARRLYDSDLNSEDGDLDYDKLMRNACSPMHNVTISPKVQQPPAENTSTQPPAINSAIQNTQDSNERAFTFGGFTKKQTNTTHRFF